MCCSVGYAFVFGAFFHLIALCFERNSCCVRLHINNICISSGVNLLVGTENGLMLLDRSGQGKVYNLITRRRFQQMDVLEGLNVLVTISGTKNKLDGVIEESIFLSRFTVR